MVRFFVSSGDIATENVILTGNNANHTKVLRLKIGEQVLVCDGHGIEYLCQIAEMSSEQVLLHIISSREASTEAAVKASVYLGFPKADKLEHVIQKATELGAYEIVAFPTARCVSRPDEKSLSKKLDRWQKIAASASEQSGRGYIPKVVLLSGLQEALTRARKADKAILFYENETATTLHMALEGSSFHAVSLMTGPEGGFEEREIELAKEYGIEICTLGRRILRCETAPLCALSAVMYACGEF